MATKKLLKLKFLWNGEDPQTKLRIPGTCVFPKATSPVRRGHSENNLKKNLRIWNEVPWENFKNIMDGAQNKKVS